MKIRVATEADIPEKPAELVFDEAWNRTATLLLPGQEGL